MSKLMTGQQFADKAVNIAKNYKTLYVWGAFGAPLNAANKARYTGNNAAEYNRRADRKALILAADNDTFAFDCVGLLKGILWGWDGNLDRTYGGAIYASNGVPDIDANEMISRCSDVSTSFNLDHMAPGEAVWKQGHIGIYIGNGLAVECTPAWTDNVQITACNCDRAGYNRRNWTKHGKLPWIDYAAAGMPFVDVPKGKYYTDAVRWCWENGIVSGTDATHFSPKANIKRCDACVMMKKLYDLLKGGG